MATGPQMSTAALLNEVLDEVRGLVKVEVALARQDLAEEARRIKKVALLMSLAALFAVLGVVLLLIALAIATFPSPLPTLIIGAVLLAASLTAALWGRKAVARSPLRDTGERLAADLKVLRERTA